MPPRTLLALALLAPAATAPADDPPASIAEALAREIIGPDRSMAEVQDFAEARIPRMPEVRSAEDWARQVDRYRREAFESVLFRGEAAAWRDAETRVAWGDLIEGGPGYAIQKLSIEVIPGLWVPALLYVPHELDGKVPVVLNVNGHDAAGKAADYKQIRCINQAKRGMLALNLEWFGMGQLQGDGFRHGLINAIDLTGTTGVALHYLAMSRALDVLLAHEHADPARVAVTGLSGGGWQTIFFGGLDERVTLAVPVAGYSSFLTRVRHLEDLGDSEQTPSDLATVLDYAHLTALRAPRPTLLTFNGKDNCCFAAPHALPPLLEAATPIYRLFDRESELRHHVNQEPGDHNYGLDNRQALYRMLGDHFFLGVAGYPREEIPSDDEVKSAEELAVRLPDDNLDFRRIAVALAERLPESADPPADRAAAESRAREGRIRLRATVRPFEGPIIANRSGRAEFDGVRATRYRLRVGQTWTVPAVELERVEGEPDRVNLLIADDGRASAADLAASLLEAGGSVVAIDPFYFGEARVADKAYLFALLVGAVGERPLGIQTGQVIAAAGWLKARPEQRPIRLVAQGPRSGLIALVAAALAPEAIDEVVLHDPPGSLKEVIAEGVDFAARPEAFCFGLLRHFDVRQVAGLVAPRPLTLESPGEGARRAFGGLAPWYATFGAESAAPRVD